MNTSAIRLLSLVFGMVICSTAVGNDVIVEWNKVLSDTLLSNTSFQNPGMASRSLAMTNIAMYDALNAISPKHVPIYATPTPPTGASAEAAALAAGYRVLSEIYPDQQSLINSGYNSILATLPAGSSTNAGLSFGDTVGLNMVQLRTNDGYQAMTSYMPTGQIGKWSPDPLNPTQEAWGPEWGKLTTFALPDTSSMMPGPMPSLTSQQYTDAFNEVKELGSLNSASRTAEQTEIALFWAYDRVGMGTPMRLYLQVMEKVSAGQGNDLHENARMYALASTALADAGIVAWDAKFLYDFWRPVTGIRDADLDGNPDTIADPTWTPLGAPGGLHPDGSTIPDFTPPFPTYISGHATFGGALFGSLESFYGTDDISFSLTSDETPGAVRDFDSFSEAMIENGRSRVYLGIHWNFDDMVARDVGSDISGYIATNYFQPVPEPSSHVLLLAATGVLALRVRRRR